jgi:hypothetical protein
MPAEPAPYPPSLPAREPRGTTTPAAQAIMVDPPKQSIYPSLGKPIMGAWTADELNGSILYTAWTGGEPNKEWTSATTPGATVHAPATPLAYRPTNVDKQSKLFNLLIAPSKPGEFKPYDPDYPLTIFERDTAKHFENHGMDSIMYVLSPMDDTTMISVITEHSLLTKSYVKTQVERNRVKYDAYDRYNELCAKNYLEASTHSTLTKKLDPFNVKTTSPAELYMMIVQKAQSSSLERAAMLIDKAKTLQLNHFPAENVSLYLEAIAEIHKGLESLNQVPVTFPYTIIKTLGLCTHPHASLWMVKHSSNQV